MMINHIRYGLLAILFSFQTSLQAQETGYFLTTNKGELLEISLEDASTIKTVSLSFTEGAQVRDALVSGDSLIYIMTWENSGATGSDKVLYKYTIDTEQLEQMGKLPISSGSSAYFEEILDGSTITFLVSEDDFPSRFRILDLNSFEFSEHAGFARGDGTFETFKNPVDNSSWFWPYDPELAILSQFSPDRDFRNNIELDANTEGSINRNPNMSAFDAKGDLYKLRIETSGNVWKRYLRKVSFEDKVITDIGSLEPESTSGFLLIPITLVYNRPQVAISPPSVKIEKQVVDLPVITIPVTLSNVGNEPFTVNDATLGTEIFSLAMPGALTLNPGEKHVFNVDFAPTDESLFRDTLEILANGEGVYKKIPLEGQVHRVFDERTVEAVKPNVPYAQTISGVVELNDAFEEQSVIAEFCATCIYSISPAGRLYRIDVTDEDVGLEVLDAGTGEYHHVRNLKEQSDNELIGFSFDGNYSLAYLNELRFYCCSGPANPGGTLTIIRYVFNMDVLNQRIPFIYNQITDYHADMSDVYVEPGINKLFALYERDENRTGIISVEGRDTEYIEVQEAFSHLYWGKGANLIALDRNAGVYAIDFQNESAVRVATFAGTMIGIWHQGGDDVEIGYESLDFGEVELDQGKTFAVRVFNQKEESVTLSSLDLNNNTLFTHGVSLPVTIEAGAMVDLPITFRPVETVQSEDQITLSFADGQGDFQKSLSLRGLGVEIDSGGGDPDPDPDPDPVTSLEKEISLEQIRVFPNPASASGHLNFEGVPARVKELKFFNTHGQLAQTYSTQRQARFRIDISQFATAGIMLVKFISEDGEYLGFKRVLLKR